MASSLITQVTAEVNNDCPEVGLVQHGEDSNGVNARNSQPGEDRGFQSASNSPITSVQNNDGTCKENELVSDYDRYKKKSSVSENQGIWKKLFGCCFCKSISEDAGDQTGLVTFAKEHELPYTAEEGALLPEIKEPFLQKKLLVIDLDETLVHSTFKPIEDPDYIVPVDIEGVIHKVYVKKRPKVDEFLNAIRGRFECVLFTASLDKYADPVTDFLDPSNTVFQHRLFREGCVQYRGNFVKDLSKLGRELNTIIILDNSPVSYLFHPENALPIRSWFDDEEDTELLKILPVLEDISKVNDAREILGRHLVTQQPAQTTVGMGLSSSQIQVTLR
eukprot:Nk52_evm15s805 gene=Nk52_evmTU15s805